MPAKCDKNLQHYHVKKLLSRFHIPSEINHFPNKSWFIRVCSTSLLKTLWEKEKLLVTSNFPFSHHVFYPFEDFTSIFFKFELSSANSFSLEESKFGKRLFSLNLDLPLSCLTLSQTSPGLYLSAVQVLKTLLEKEKLQI